MSADEKPVLSSAERAVVAHGEAAGTVPEVDTVDLEFDDDRAVITVHRPHAG